MKRTIVGHLACVVGVLTSGATNAFGATTGDDFNDGVTNPLVWRIETSGGPMVQERAGGVVVDVPSTAAGDLFYGRYVGLPTLVGDFDMQVEYHLDQWPPYNGLRTGLSFEWSGHGVAMERTCLSTGGGEVYLADYGADLTYFGTTDTEGILRLIRTGSVITCLCFTNGQWYGLASKPVTTSPGRFTVWVWSSDAYFGHQNASVRFDNFQASDQGQRATLAPVSQNVGLGRVTGGDLQSLAFDDGNAEQICKFVVPSNSAPIVRLDLGFDCPFTEPAAIDLVVKLKWLNAGLYTARLSQYDFLAGQFDQCLADTVVSGSYQVLYGQSTSQPERFVEVGTQRTLGRVEIRSTGPTTAVAPCVAFEFANQVVTG